MKRVFNANLLYRRASLIIYDIAAVALTSFLAIAMRYEFVLMDIPKHFMTPIIRFLPINIILTLVIFYIFRLYNSLWAFASETELQNLVSACVISTIVDGVGLYLFKVDIRPVPLSYHFR